MRCEVDIEPLTTNRRRRLISFFQLCKMLRWRHTTDDPVCPVGKWCLVDNRIKDIRLDTLVLVKSQACWKKGWGAPSPDRRNQRGSVWRPASAKEHPDGQDTGIRTNTREAQGTDGGSKRVGGLALGARAAGGAADHRGSAGRRSEGRVGAPLLRPGCRPRRRISQRVSHRSGEERRGRH